MSGEEILAKPEAGVSELEPNMAADAAREVLAADITPTETNQEGLSKG